MSDHLNESLQSKFDRYMKDKYRETGHIPTFKEYEAEYERYIENHYEQEDYV